MTSLRVCGGLRQPSRQLAAGCLRVRGGLRKSRRRQHTPCSPGVLVRDQVPPTQRPVSLVGMAETRTLPHLAPLYRQQTHGGPHSTAGVARSGTPRRWRHAAAGCMACPKTNAPMASRPGEPTLPTERRRHRRRAAVGHRATFATESGTNYRPPDGTGATAPHSPANQPEAPWRCKSRSPQGRDHRSEVRTVTAQHDQATRIQRRITEDGSVIVPPRIAAWLEQHAGVTADLRVRLRGVDSEAYEVLAALHLAALHPSSSVRGTKVAPSQPDTTKSNMWLTTSLSFAV